jgi:Formate/nitrite transporter
MRSVGVFPDERERESGFAFMSPAASHIHFYTILIFIRLLFEPSPFLHGYLSFIHISTHQFAEKGRSNARMHWLSILHQSILGGCYVGFGCLLALSVAGNMDGIGASNSGLVKFAFAALFPVNLLLILTTGAQLFTGNSAAGKPVFGSLIDPSIFGSALFGYRALTSNLRCPCCV